MDSSDFDAFYRASADRLTRQLYALTGDVGEAQDVVQEAFVRAWERWGKVSTYEDPESWVRGVAWRLAISRFRKARNAVKAWNRHGPSDPAAALDADTVALVQGLRRLPEAQRVVLVLHHMVDRSVEQIADDLGVPIGTVKARLSRGRAALAQHLSEDHPSALRPTPGASHA